MGVHSREESAAMYLYSLANTMTMIFFVLFYSSLVLLGTASFSSKGQWQTGPEQMTGLKHLAWKPPHQDTSF